MLSIHIDKYLVDWGKGVVVAQLLGEEIFLRLGDGVYKVDGVEHLLEEFDKRGEGEDLRKLGIIRGIIY